MVSPKMMLLGYIEYLDSKIKRISDELESFKSMNISKDDHLFSMIKKDKIEKEVLKLISQIQLRDLENGKDF